MEPAEIVAKMLETDAFSRWLGIQVVHIGAGTCVLEFTITEQMLNGFDQVHGGILFSAADSALAFAANTRGNIAVALDASVSFTAAAKLHERLTVTAEELHCGNKTGVYQVRITDENGNGKCFFKGTVYRTSKTLA